MSVKTTSVVLLLLAGMGITAVVTFLITRPTTVTLPYRAIIQPKTYNNEETWRFLKDKDGRVTGVEIHRKAEQN